MNKNSNTYVIIYSAVMVILVAVVLAFTSEALKERKQANLNADTMKQILSALHVEPGEDAVATYDETIVEAYVVNDRGEIIEGSEGTSVEDAAFNVRLTDMKQKPEYPVFVANINGETKYVLGMTGAGLWGGLWGYIALNDDANTVYGVDLSHEGETPGLGAEITESWFVDQFNGKHIFRDGQLVSIAVVKPGKGVTDREYIDGISGGTLTSTGVNDMLEEALQLYEPFLNHLRNE